MIPTFFLLLAAPDGNVQMRFSLDLGPPIYCPVLALPSGDLAVVDNEAVGAS